MCNAFTLQIPWNGQCLGTMKKVVVVLRVLIHRFWGRMNIKYIISISGLVGSQNYETVA